MKNFEKLPNNNSEELPENNKETSITRREFLKKSLQGIGGLCFMNYLTSESYGNHENEENKESEESEEVKLEKLKQKSFYEDFAKRGLIYYGDRLYTNQELLNPKFIPDQAPFHREYSERFPNTTYSIPSRVVFNLNPEVRVLQYFLRNNREETLKNAKELGCQYHQTELDSSHPLENIFRDAGIDIEGEKVEWLEVFNGGSGSMHREGERYGGEDEIIMVVEKYTEELDEYCMLPAQNAGYEVDTVSEFESTVANEITHEIQHKYFPSLFLEKKPKKNNERLDQPFKSFTTEVPDLRFVHNLQAAEFLSDVSDWVVGGKNGNYSRFFNSLYYMDPNSEYYQKTKIIPKEDNYWYSYQVQKYAMEIVLKEKGYEDPKAIVDEIIKVASSRTYKNVDDLFIFAIKYFIEDDFEKIAKIYRRIGVELLSKMKPYFLKPKEE
jgi:hypothetical protein